MTDSPVAVVTGGAQGIGAAICTELLKNGYRVCIADIQKSKAKELATEQQKIYGEENIIALGCDVSKESEYSKLFEETLKHFQKVDVLINNAGIIREQDPRKCIEVNLLGPVTGCHAAIKYMGKSRGGNGGVVINTASLTSFVPFAEIPVYVASKHGVLGLTRSFGMPFHYNKEGIIFAALCPHFVDTEILKTTTAALDPTFDLSERNDKISPEFVAKGVIKILEDKINGSSLSVGSDGYHYEELEEKFKVLIP